MTANALGSKVMGSAGMSLEAYRWAWRQQTDSLSKLVLLCLAEHHNGTDGQCNPKVQTICRETGLGRATIFDRLERLRDAKLITVDSRNRGGNQYLLDFEKGPHHEPFEPEKGPRDGPFEPKKGPYYGKGPRHTDHPLLEPESEPEEKREVARLRAPASDRGTRIPDDFKPDLSVALAEGMNGSEAERCAANFLDYWKAKPGAAGRKVDWPATWRIWCRREVSRPNGAAKSAREKGEPRNAFDVAAVNLRKQGIIQ
ncbi:helix-turn-helix domain-containing protein [Mesorhizobium sp. M1E.F.Ca.ET.041.01.1.1]|uniref:helix-turn-helix domain-containing protein n=1 Tax=Mesorhizobium sp. M1E.F.Ca.ET.041.01.1.1 TaxID=2496759 RepID=UPI00167B49B0|nr:helix-turn-helix domain-containing protein [Mesorhizobium sp. M1E.F.Ca.ET.041.01.1.1]